jgi:flagellar biosynthesis protein FliP
MTNQSQALSNAGASKSHMPLAALCVLAVALAAFFFVMNPRIAEMHAKAQALLTEEVARENTAFCEKRGFAAGAREFTSCVADLNELRAKQDKRTYESVFGLI